MTFALHNYIVTVIYDAMYYHVAVNEFIVLNVNSTNAMTDMSWNT